MSKENTSDNLEKKIKDKIDELRKFSHSGVTDDKLRQGALIALGLKSIY